MSTTTIRLDDELRARLADVVAREGTTSHAYIVDAVERSIEASEADAAFQRVVDARWASFLKHGKSIPGDEGLAYMRALAAGQPAKRPKARKLIAADLKRSR